MRSLSMDQMVAVNGGDGKSTAEKVICNATVAITSGIHGAWAGAIVGGVAGAVVGFVVTVISSAVIGAASC